MRKPHTEQEALATLAALCSQAEHCTKEMTDKMDKWELPEEAQSRILEYLRKEKYLDDERYTRFFARDKIRYNKWGRRKVEQALYMKRIPKEISTPVLNDIEEEMYVDILRPLLQQKRKSTKAASDYELRMKLIRFALQRGFTMDIIQQCLDTDGCDGADEEWED